MSDIPAAMQLALIETEKLESRSRIQFNEMRMCVFYSFASLLKQRQQHRIAAKGSKFTKKKPKTRQLLAARLFRLSLRMRCSPTYLFIHIILIEQFHAFAHLSWLLMAFEMYGVIVGSVRFHSLEFGKYCKLYHHGLGTQGARQPTTN